MSEYENQQPSETDKREANEVIKIHDGLKSARQVTEDHWQECMTYIVPRKGDITSSRQAGQKVGQELFDSTAINANELLAAALHGMLTNPAIRFFELVFGDPALDRDEEVKKWLEEVSDRMFVLMNNSNFQTEIHEIYIDLGSIGTACLFIGEHPNTVVHFGARAMKEIYIRENNLGLIDQVNREFKWKARQIVQEFGEDKVHPFVRKKYQEGREDDFTIVHETKPISDELKKDNPKKHAFSSKYVLKEEAIVLSRDGFREFPYAVPRFSKTSGEQYGRGPGMSALPDIKMVNKMMETTLQGAQITVSPPFEVEDDSVIGKLRLTPGGLVVRRPGSNPMKALVTNANIDFGYQAVEDVRKRIRSAFYVDQLQLNEGPQMTAAEVFQRTEEKLRLMGPVLGRQHFEFLRPVVERVFAIMVRRGLVPQPPAKIQGKKFDVRYSSLVARAQRMSEGQNLTRALSVAGPIINAIPEALDLLKGDEAVKHVFDTYGVPHRLFRDEREVQKIRDGRDKANQELVEQQKQAHAAEMASKVAPGAAQLMQAQKEQQQK